MPVVEDGEGAAGRLARFRRELYWCLWRCPDALACPSRTSLGPADHRAYSYVMLSKCGNILVERLAALVGSPSPMFNRRLSPFFYMVRCRSIADVWAVLSWAALAFGTSGRRNR